MKKILAMLMAAILTVGLLAACGQAPSSSSEADRSEPDRSETSSSSRVRPDRSQSESESEEPVSEPKTSDVSIEEQVLYDDNDVVITAKSFDPTGHYDESPVIKLIIENNGDDVINVSTDYSAVNGYMVSTSLYAEIQAGKKSNEDLSFASTDLYLTGIETIGEIEMTFSIRIGDSYDNYVYSDVVTIETSAYRDMDYAQAQKGEQILDQDGIVVTYLGEDTSGQFLSSYKAIYVFQLENTGDASYYVDMDDFSINGYMADGVYMSGTVWGGKIAYLLLVVREDVFEENDIDKVEELEFVLDTRPTDGSYSDIKTSDIITIKV